MSLSPLESDYGTLVPPAVLGHANTGTTEWADGRFAWTMLERQADSAMSPFQTGPSGGAERIPFGTVPALLRRSCRTSPRSD
jgi:hypothetical protein